MLELAIVAALILLNGFFAMSEMALVTSRKTRLRQMAVHSRGAAKALALAEQPDNLLSTVQVGITLIGILTGVFGGEAIGLYIAQGLSVLWPSIEEYARGVGIGTAVTLITAGQVIFGELVPKRLAISHAERIASVVAIPLDALARLAKPVVLGLGAINRAVLRLLGIRDAAGSHITEEEIRLLVSESHEQGLIDEDERNMMNRVMRLGDRSAESLMTPRTRIAWLDAESSLEENLETMRETPFSRYPVYSGNDQNVLGVLEVKALLSGLRLEAAPQLFQQLRPAVFVSESTQAMKLLEIFREEAQSLALVVDEYGDISGVVTANDVLSAVVGRLQTGNEGLEYASPVVTRADGSLLVDGSLPVDDLRELLGSTRLPEEDSHDYHTAAGMLIACFGQIPHVGEYLDWDGWRIEVVDLDGPRIDKLLLQRQEKPGEHDD